MIRSGRDPSPSRCTNKLPSGNNALLAPYQRTGQNVYDVRGKCEDSSNLCYSELGYISEYLNRKDVMKSLGAEVSSYDSCNFDINRNFLFAGDWLVQIPCAYFDGLLMTPPRMRPFHRLVPGLLEQIPVLIYAGDADFICNWLGNLGWTNALEWSGHKEYKNAELKTLKTDLGEASGKIKAAGNLTFVQIHAAGHMVPYDQPLNSLDMFNRWLQSDL